MHRLSRNAEDDQTSGTGKHQVADRLGSRSYLDFDVVAESIQAIHQFAFGQIREVAAHRAFSRARMMSMSVFAEHAVCVAEGQAARTWLLNLCISRMTRSVSSRSVIDSLHAEQKSAVTAGMTVVSPW